MVHKIDLENEELRNKTNFTKVSTKFHPRYESSTSCCVFKAVLRKSERCRLVYSAIPDIIGADIFHDLDEGVCKDVIEQIWNFFGHK